MTHSNLTIFKDATKLGTELKPMGFVSEIDKEVLSKLSAIGKPRKFVADWKIIECAPSECSNEDLQPFYIVANAKIDQRYTTDSRMFFAQSSCLQQFHLNCIFETANTCYVLCNSGSIEYK
ncbi:MAG: hypothetical protein V2I33_16300 [Kangiellaceae bacterium]|jgi:hypothetical protein|nr:hypothetical protein [Kangiellaceae bacterium]